MAIGGKHLLFFWSESHSSSLLGIDASTTSSPCWQTHSLGRSFIVQNLKRFVIVQVFLTSNVLRRRAGESRWVWDGRGLYRNNRWSYRDRTHIGWSAFHVCFRWRGSTNGGCSWGYDTTSSSFAIGCWGSLGRQCSMQPCGAGGPLGLDHTAVVLSQIAMARDGAGLVEVCLCVVISIAIITIIFRSWKKKKWEEKILLNSLGLHAVDCLRVFQVSY